MLDENALHARTLLEKLNTPDMSPVATPTGVSAPMADPVALPPVEHLYRHPDPEIAANQSFAQQLQSPPAPIAAPPAAPMMPHPASTPEPALPAGLILSPAQLALAQANTANQAQGYIRRDANTAKKAVNEQAALAVQQADSEKEAAANLAEKQQLSEVRLAEQTAAINKQMEQSMTHYQSVNAEMEKMASEAPQDLFGQAGVNRIGAAISIFLGGAGTNGNKPNANLEMIKNLADRNVQAQRNRYDMLARVGQGEQTMFGMLQNKLQNTTAVEASMQNAYLNTYKNQLLASAAQFAGPKAMNQAKIEVAKIDQLMHNNTIAAQESYQTKAQNNIALAQQGQILALQEAHKDHKEQVEEAKLAFEIAKEDKADDKYERENQIEGFKGTFNPKEHNRISKMVGGARSIITSLDEIDKMIKSGADPRTIRAFYVAQAQAFKASRDYYETGTRLEAGEEKQIAQTSLNQFDAILAMVASGAYGGDPTGLQNKIEDAKALIVRGAYQSAHTAAPNVKFDDSDELWGRYNPKTYKSEYEKRAEARHGTEKGRRELADLPTYNPEQYGGY